MITTMPTAILDPTYHPEIGIVFSGLGWEAALTGYEVDRFVVAKGVVYFEAKNKWKYWGMMTDELGWLVHCRQQFDVQASGRLGLHEYWS